LKEKVPIVALKKLLDEREMNDEEERNKETETKIKYQKQMQPYL
jgi:hypothetical protein